MGPGSTIASLLIKLGLDPSGVSKGVSDANRSMAGLEKQSKENARNTTLMVAGAGAVMGDFVASSAQKFVAFDDGMREIFSLLPGMSGKAMEEMKGQVRSLAQDMGASTDSIIAGMYQSVSAFGAGADTITKLEIAAKAAVAGVAETGDAVSLLSAVTKGYGDASVAAVQHASDLATQTIALGQTTFPELSASMGKVVAQASALGVSQEELFAGFATLAGVTGNTAEVSTQLKAIFTALVNPSTQAAAAIKAAGYESGTAMVEALGLGGALKELEKQAGGDQAAFAKMMGSSEALTASLALNDKLSQGYADNLTKLGDVTGKTTAAYDTLAGGVGGASRKLGAFINDLALSMGKFIEPVAPLFMAFGPQMGRWLGRGMGAALGLSIKGLGGIVRRALPSMAADLTAAGAEAGGGMARGLAKSMSGKMRSVWLAVVSSGPIRTVIAAAGAAAGVVYSTAVGVAAKIGTAIMGAFGMAAADSGVIAAAGAAGVTIGGLIQAGIIVGVTVGLAVLLQKVLEQPLSDIAKGVSKALGGTGNIPVTYDADAAVARSRAARKLEADEKSAAEVQGRWVAQFILSGGRGQKAAAEQGQKLADIILGGWKSAVGAVKTGAAAATTATTEAGEKIVGAARIEQQRLRAAISDGASKLTAAWDTVSQAMAKGPKIMSFKKRMQGFNRAATHVLNMLAKARRAHDPVTEAYYADQYQQVRGAQYKTRTSYKSTQSDVNKILAQGRRRQRMHGHGIAMDAAKEGRQKARQAHRDAKKTAEAQPKALRAAQGQLQRGLDVVKTAVLSMFGTTAADASTYGNDVGSNFAAGITNQYGAVVAAAASLAAGVHSQIGFSRGPKTGPLKGIHKWGEHMVVEWVRPIHDGTKKAHRAGNALAEAVYPKRLRWASHDWLRHLKAMEKAGHDLNRKQERWLSEFERRRHIFARRHQPRGGGGGGGGGGGRGGGSGSIADVRHMRVHTLDADRLSARTANVQHFHVGTLIANDKGLDELDRRTNRRRRVRHRQHRDPAVY